MSRRGGRGGKCSLPFHLWVQLKLPQSPHHPAPRPRMGRDEAVTCFGMGQPNLLRFQQHLLIELCPHVVWSCCVVVRCGVVWCVVVWCCVVWCGVLC